MCLQMCAPIVIDPFPVSHIKAVRSPDRYRCSYSSSYRWFNISAVYGWGSTTAEYPARNGHKCKEGVNRTMTLSSRPLEHILC